MVVTLCIILAGTLYWWLKPLKLSDPVAKQHHPRPYSSAALSDRVKQLQFQPPSFRARERERLPPDLCYYASAGNITKVKPLLDALVSQHDATSFAFITGMALLVCICSTTVFSTERNARFAVARLLLSCGADPNVPDDFNMTAIMYAVYNGLGPEVELLLEHKADIHTCMKCWAGGKIAVLRLAMARMIDQQSSSHHAEVPAVCQALLSAGVDVNARGPGHVTPLHLACAVHPPSDAHEADHGLAICKILLLHGAEINAREEDDRTPLHYALSRISPFGPGTVSLLIEHGADLDAKDNEGMTPLGNSSEHLSALYESPGLSQAARARLLPRIPAPRPHDNAEGSLHRRKPR